MRWPLVAISVSFVALFATVGTAWLLCVSEAAVVGPPTPPSELEFQRRIVPFPETLTVEEVRDLIRPLKRAVLGCGVGDWNGKSQPCWWNHYSEVAVPWLEEPTEVVAGFTGVGLMSFQVNKVYYECNPGEEILKRRAE